MQQHSTEPQNIPTGSDRVDLFVPPVGARDDVESLRRELASSGVVGFLRDLWRAATDTAAVFCSARTVAHLHTLESMRHRVSELCQQDSQKFTRSLGFPRDGTTYLNQVVGMAGNRIRALGEQFNNAVREINTRLEREAQIALSSAADFLQGKPGPFGAATTDRRATVVRVVQDEIPKIQRILLELEGFYDTVECLSHAGRAHEMARANLSRVLQGYSNRMSNEELDGGCGGVVDLGRALLKAQLATLGARQTLPEVTADFVRSTAVMQELQALISRCFSQVETKIGPLAKTEGYGAQSAREHLQWISDTVQSLSSPKDIDPRQGVDRLLNELRTRVGILDTET